MTVRHPFRLGFVARAAGRTLVAAGLVLALGGFAFFEAWLAPKAEPWPRWLAYDPASLIRIDHARWDKFLKANVERGPEGVNRVRYGRVSGTDRRALGEYLESLAGVPVDRLNRDQQRAYWINLYNALTVDLILRSYPVASIKDIDGAWDQKRIAVAGEPVGLNDIEHRILRPIWKDPRLHYAVNCAALGCPDLQATAFTAENAEALLDAAAGTFVNHRRGARVENGRLIVSKIYLWFREDFGNGAAPVILHLRRFAGPALTTALAGRDSIDDYEYDWRLNDEAP